MKRNRNKWKRKHCDLCQFIIRATTTVSAKCQCKNPITHKTSKSVRCPSNPFHKQWLQENRQKLKERNQYIRSQVHWFRLTFSFRLTKCPLPPFVCLPITHKTSKSVRCPSNPISFSFSTVFRLHNSTVRIRLIEKQHNIIQDNMNSVLNMLYSFK